MPQTPLRVEVVMKAYRVPVPLGVEPKFPRALQAASWMHLHGNEERVPEVYGECMHMLAE